ncbi:aminotransferase class IV [bacterium]|nr:aminotransferase class IV [bacterium]
MLSYFNGTFMPDEDIRISPLDRGFTFADSLYEVIRAYDGKMFRPEAHIARLNLGAKELRYNRNDFSELIEVGEKLIAENGLITGDALVYIQVTRGVYPRTHRFPPSDVPLTVYVNATPFEPKREQHATGVSAITVPEERWARCHIKSTGLLPHVLAHQVAAEAGAYEALFVRDGYVLEGTRSNFVMIKRGTLVTQPRTNSILPGTTLAAILDICEELNIPTQDRRIPTSELLEANEMFVLGTATEVMPIVEIDGHTVGDGTPGPLTKQIQISFDRFVRS